MIEASWLTGVLRDAGVLPRGEVTSVEVTDTGAFNSTTVYARVTYRGADGPARLVVKRPAAAAWSRAAAVEEARFYRFVAAMPDHPPVVPRCYAVDDDYLVLEDLSDAYEAPTTRDAMIALRGVPEAGALDAAVDALARLHSYWWGRDPGPLPVATWWGDAERFDAYSRRRRAAWSKVRAEVPRDLRGLYEFVFGRHDRFWRGPLRDRMARPLTLVHGDAYLSNYLVGPAGAVLLDWQGPAFDVGAVDLANMCATFWTRDQRRRDEERVLRRYHATLGRADHPYDDLLTDYRIGIADWLTVPVQDAADGSGPGYWRPKMRCLADAFEDLDVASLFR